MPSRAPLARRSLATLALLAALLAPVPARAAETGPGRYIVTLKAGGGAPAEASPTAATLSATRAAAPARAQTASALAGRYGGKVTSVYRSVLNGFAVIGLDAGKARALANDPAVEQVVQDAAVHLFAQQPSPPAGLDRIDQRRGRDQQYAYPNAARGSGVHAYIIDTGLYAAHADFGGRATADHSSIHEDPGRDPTDPTDCNGHGTHVAGTIGGATYGVAKDVRLHGVRALRCAGSGWESEVIEAVDWVTDNHRSPAVVNMSLGFGSGSAEFLSVAVAASIATGLTYVVSAGNGDASHNAVDAATATPARVPSALTVSAVDPATDVRPTWANFGASVDLFAPGTGILSAYIGSPDAKATMDGTSMAAPHVAGAVARYLQVNPNASPATVAETIIGDATPGVVGAPGPGAPNRLLHAAPDAAPRGAVEQATRTTVTGWADDRSCAGPVQVQVWADPAGSEPNAHVATVPADKPHDRWGQHGFEAVGSFADGTVVTGRAVSVDGDCKPDALAPQRLAGSPTAPSGPSHPPGGSQVFVPVGQRAGMSTGIQILNGAATPAEADVDYVNADGSVAKTDPVTVPANGAFTSVQRGPADPGWSGSVRITGRNGANDLTAVANHVLGGRVSSSAGFSSGSPNGSGAGAATIQLPLLMRNNGPFTTWFALQNTSSVPAHVKIGLKPVVKPGEVLVPAPLVEDDIAPGAARIYHQSDVTLEPKYTLMTATIEANTNIAATVFQESPDSLMEYASLTDADKGESLTIPLVMANNYGNFTGVQVTNAGNGRGGITITYGPNTATRFDPKESPRGLCPTPVPAARADVYPARAVTFLQRGLGSPDDDPQFAGCTYIGAATVTSTGRVPLIAAVNQVGPGLASSYEARPTTVLSNSVRLPLIQVNNYGITGGLQVANAGGPTTATITFGPNIAPAPPPDKTDLPRPCPAAPAPLQDIALGTLGTVTKLLPADVPGTQGCTYIGSVEVTAGRGARLAILANQLSPSGTDRLATYAAP
jgi:subtilisin family serine protease